MVESRTLQVKQMEPVGTLDSLKEKMSEPGPQPMPKLSDKEMNALQEEIKAMGMERLGKQTAALEHARKVKEQEAAMGSAAPTVSLMQCICDMLEARDLTGRASVKYRYDQVYDASQPEYTEALGAQR